MVIILDHRVDMILNEDLHEAAKASSQIEIVSVDMDWIEKHKYQIELAKIDVRIYLSSDHCVYPQNQTSDTMTTQLSAIYRRERNEGV